MWGSRWDFLKAAMRGVLTARPVRWGALVVFVLWLAFISMVRYIEPGEAALTWRPISGEITMRDRPGWDISPPWAFVTVIDTRPQRLCLTSTAHSAPNCRLAQFDTSQYRAFIAAEGWSWYWFRNRLSFNYGYDETYRGWRDVMRGYTFSQHQYPFIRYPEGLAQ